jgi:putative colanic acid biosynthesis acetyltransferase WcaF
MRRIVRLMPNGTYKLDSIIFSITPRRCRTGGKMQRLKPAICLPRRSKSCWAHGAGPKIRSRIGIARSVQAMYEEAFFHLIGPLQQRSGLSGIALAGGCAMNSVANGKIRRKTPFRRVYVQSAAGDAGGAIGADYDAPSVTAPASPIRAFRGSQGGGAPFRPSSHPLSNRLARALWGGVWLLLFRPSPRIFPAWRRILLRCFGARISRGVRVDASTRIWAPWNLEMGSYSCLGPRVDCYSVDTIRIGAYVTVSQYSFLCAASHDPDSAEMTLTTAPIVIGDHAWIAADVFIAPGVIVGEGAVIGARSSVFKNVPEWIIAVGSPAREIRKRTRAVADGVAALGPW